MVVMMNKKRILACLFFEVSVLCGAQLKEPTDLLETQERQKINRQWIKDICLQNGVLVNSVENSAELCADQSRGNAAIGYDLFAKENKLIVGYGYGLTPFTNEVMLPADQREFLITHECGHRLNHDHEKNTMYMINNPLLIGTVYKGIRLVKKSPRLGVVAAVGAGIAHALYYPQFRKNAERRADLTTKKPEILEAGARLFERWHNDEKDKKESIKSLTLWDSCKNYFTCFHDNHLDRATKVRKQAEKLRF